MTRLVLGALGVLGIGYALLGMLTHLPPDQLIGVLAWLAAALLLHDGVLVPLTTLSGHGLRRLGSGLTGLSQTFIRAVLLFGAVTTLLVAPLLKAQMVLQPSGPESGVNTTVLQGNYTLSLAFMWAALLVCTAAAVAIVEVYARLASRSRGAQT